MPVVNLNEFGGANCARSTQNQDFRNLIHKVNIIGEEDEREPLSASAAKLGMNAEEVQQAYACTGVIVCKNGAGKSKQQSAGAVCATENKKGDGKCAGDRLVTSAHGFINKKTNSLEKNLESCEFSNYKGFKSKLSVDDLGSIQTRNPSTDPAKNFRSDKVVVRLKQAIPGCNAYQTSGDSKSLPPETPITVISAYQVGTKAIGDKSNGEHPIGYGCSVKKSWQPKGGAAGVFYSDCDLDSGGSGSIVLSRDAQGKLNLSGIMIIASGMPDYKPYSEKDENYSIGVAANGDMISLIEEPGTIAPSLNADIQPPSGSTFKPTSK